jgi:DNA-binding transcriptional ArsR family regulator
VFNPSSPLVDEEILEAISVVTEPTRLQILFFLGESGPVCVNDITSRFSISRPAISHHLKVLKNHRLVRSEKVGQEVYYVATVGVLAPKLRGLADTLEQCCPAEGKTKQKETPSSS